MMEVKRRDTGKPGGRLWLIKWLVVVALVILVILLISVGPPTA